MGEDRNVKTEEQKALEKRQSRSIFTWVSIFAIIAIICYVSVTMQKDINLLNGSYREAQRKLNAATEALTKVENKKQEIEQELMKTYGLPLDSIMNKSAKEIILKKSLQANDAINKLATNYVPNRGNVKIDYYTKSIDQDKISFALQSLGYQFTPKDPKKAMESKKTSCIWFGRNVAVKDCQVVALALIRGGIEIKKIRRYKASETNASYKSNIIEVGASVRVENGNFPPLTVDDVTKASDFPYDEY